jgi:hypothetical protein
MIELPKLPGSAACYQFATGGSRNRPIWAGSELRPQALIRRKPSIHALFVRADAGTRTPDPFITSEVLYQLSYVGKRALKLSRSQAPVGRR